MPGRGRGDRDRPAGAGGPRRAAADRGDAGSTSSPPAFLLEEVAGHIGDAISGVIVAGRQLDPELREPLAHLARASGFPILAEPTSQLRCGPHDRSHVVAAYDLLLRDEHFARSVVPDLVLRFGEMPTSKPLRAWLAASGADQIVVDPLRRLERADPPGGGDPARRPDRAGRGLGGAAGGEERDAAPERWLDGRDARRGRRSTSAELDGPATLTEPALHRALGRAHRDGDLVYTASSMPIRDQEAFLAAGDADVALPLQPRRQRHRRPDLLRDRRRPRQRPPDHDRHRRPRPAPRPRRPRRPARRLHPGPDRRHRQRRRRHLPLPAAGGGAGRARSSRPCSAPRAASTPPRPRRSSTSPTAASSRSTDLPEALAAGTGLIEVKTDRQANVEVHRRLGDRSSSASSDRHGWTCLPRRTARANGANGVGRPSPAGAMYQPAGERLAQTPTGRSWRSPGSRRPAHLGPDGPSRATASPGEAISRT